MIRPQPTFRWLRETGRDTIEEDFLMANHLTPDELSEALGLPRKQVVRLCVETSVPIYNGRIDKTLFVRSVTAAGHRLPSEQAEVLLEATG